jgi:MoxR-like ATPase
VDVPAVGPEVMAEILRTRRRGAPPPVSRALDERSLAEAFALVDRVHLPDAVASYVARLVAATHPTRPESPASARASVRYGASPRAAIAIGEAARAAALLAGRPNVDFDDVARVAPAALAHRLVLEHSARVDGTTPAAVVSDLLAAVPAVERPLPKAAR